MENRRIINGIMHGHVRFFATFPFKQLFELDWAHRINIQLIIGSARAFTSNMLSSTSEEGSREDMLS